MPVEGARAFIPAGFEPPLRLVSETFVLEPLGPEHNEADYGAWSSSIAHIRRTPGFEVGGWPRPMSLDDNRRDLEMHARHFEQRLGFTYTVLDPKDGDVIGCVYIYPHDATEADAGREADENDASVRSWVRADRATLDEPLRLTVSDWLRVEWPFANVRYATGS